MNAKPETPAYPLVGSIQNSVGMGFAGNQAAFAVANALGARVVAAPSAFSSAHGGLSGRAHSVVEPQHFRRDVAFLVAQRPIIVAVGYLPTPEHVEIVAERLRDYKGVVLVDPVIGDYRKGLFVGAETARAIAELLVPMAQIVTPNRFEAEVLLGREAASEYAYLNGLFDLGPRSVIVTSFEREPEKRSVTVLFSNGYRYDRISAPYVSGFPAHGAGDVYAAAVATFCALGASPFAAAMLATALAARAVAETTAYGGFGVEPVAALAAWNPRGQYDDDARAVRFCERSNVACAPVEPTAAETRRLKLAPPKHAIVYG